MSQIFGRKMKRAIVRARKRLMSIDASLMADCGLNRYRIAQKKLPILITIRKTK